MSIFPDNIVFSPWHPPGRIADSSEAKCSFPPLFLFFLVMPARPVAADCYIFQLVFRNDRSLTRMGDNEAVPELHRLLTPNDSHFGDFTGAKNIKSRNAW